MKRRTLWLAQIAAVAVLAAGPGASESQDQFDADKKIVVADAVVGTANGLLRFYASLPPLYRFWLAPVANDIAKIRRPAMALLIDDAPGRALERTLGRADRVNLPDTAVSVLETQVDAIGDFNHIQHQRTFDGKSFSYIEQSLRLLTVGERTFVDPSVYGRRLVQLSKEALPVHGIALDGRFAWSEQPYRPLDPVERIENQVPPELIAIFIGDELNLVPLDGDLADLGERLIAREGFVGPELLDPLDDEVLNLLLDMLWTTGTKEILWLPVDFDEAPGSRFTRNADTDAMIADAKEWIELISRGQTTIDVTYFPGILRLGPDAFASANRIPGAVLGEADRALQAYDRDNGATGQWLLNSWDRVIIIADEVLIDATGAVQRGAFANDARYMVFYGLTLPFFLQHELGHTYYFGHAFYLSPTTPDRTGPGTLFPMPWTYMGQGVAGGDNRQHPASANKLAAFWIASSEWLDATAGGTFRIVSHDRGPSGFARLLRVQTDDAREYWVDMRRLWPEVAELQDGVQIYYTEDTFPGRFIGNPVYVGPTSAGGPFTSPFAVGETMEDPRRGVRIRVLNVGEDPFIAGAFFADILVERF